MPPGTKCERPKADSSQRRLGMTGVRLPSLCTKSRPPQTNARNDKCATPIIVYTAAAVREPALKMNGCLRSSRKAANRREARYGQVNVSQMFRSTMGWLGSVLSGVELFVQPASPLSHIWMEALFTG